MLVHAGSKGSADAQGHWIPRYRIHHYLHPAGYKLDTAPEVVMEGKKRVTYFVSPTFHMGALTGGDKQFKCTKLASKFKLGQPSACAAEGVRRIRKR